MLHDTGGLFFGMHFIWWFLWIAFLATAFTTGAPVPRSLLKKGERALDILRRRYAAGQMTTDEYERRKAVLERDEPGADAAISARPHH